MINASAVSEDTVAPATPIATVRAVDDVVLLDLTWQRFQEARAVDRADRDFAEIAKERIAFTS